MSIKVNIHQNLYHFNSGKAAAEVSLYMVGVCLLDGLVKSYPALRRSYDKKSKLLTYVDIYVSLESSYPEELAKQLKMETIFL